MIYEEITIGNEEGERCKNFPVKRMIYEEITIGNEEGERCKNFPDIREPLQNSRPHKSDKKQHSEGSRILGDTVLRHSSGNLVLRICANLKHCNFPILWTDN